MQSRGTPKRRAVAKNSASRRPASTETATTSGLKLDSQGRIVADVEPSRKFPTQQEGSFVDLYQKKIEDAAAAVRTQEAANSAEPSRIIDSMKANAVQLSPTVQDYYGHIWSAGHSGDVDNEFFKDCMGALDEDIADIKKIYNKVKKETKNEDAPNLAWFSRDPELEIYTDSEEESNGRILRFPPPVRCIRKIERSAMRRHQQLILVSRALEMAKGSQIPVEQLGAKLSNNLEEVSSHSKESVKRRQELRDEQKAADYARFALSAPSSPITGNQKIVSPKHSVVSLFLTLLAERFPSAVRSRALDSIEVRIRQNERIKLTSMHLPASWLIDDSQILKNVSKFKDLVKLNIVSESHRLYISNVTTILGVPYGGIYKASYFANDFPLILQSFNEAKALTLANELNIKPRSKDLRAAVAIKLAKKSGAVQGVQVTQGSTAEVVDSDDDMAEQKQKADEELILKRIVAEGPASFSGQYNAFGPEHVSMRLGGEYGRLRNHYDISRAKSGTLEALASDPSAQVPMYYESSEDENTAFADTQKKYRKRYRLYENPLRHTVVEKNEGRSVNWPGSVLDSYKKRVEEDVKNSSPSKKKKRNVTVWRGQVYSTSADGQQVVVEEAWKTLSIKPRVRMIESRFDRGGKIPLGFVARARNIGGAEHQIIGIDEGELHRRFALNKLWQTRMTGKDVTMANRRYFALVINEREGKAKVVPYTPMKLIYSDSPKKALEDFNWEFYWREVVNGDAQNRLMHKELRYKNLKDNNYIVWKDGLEKYQKLRERVNELQTHTSPREMKLRLLSKSGGPQIRLNELPPPTSMVSALNEKVTNQNFVDKCATEVQFKKRIALRTRSLLQDNAYKAARNYKSMYQEFRRHIAERALYEQAWTQNRNKRSTEATLAAAAISNGENSTA